MNPGGRILLENCRFTGSGRECPGWLLIESGRIARRGVGRSPAGLRRLDRLDLRQHFVTPGFIDLHVHGDKTKVSRMAVRSGVTGFLLALHAGTPEKLYEAITRAGAAAEPGARCLGFYLEGSFINPAMAGAQPRAGIIRPDAKKLKTLLRKVKGTVRVVTVAPELPGAAGIIRILRNAGVRVAMGHSCADFTTGLKAAANGVTLATHLFNRMEPISARRPGLAAAVLTEDRVSVELIADKRHVHPGLLGLAVKMKPRDKIILVSDSVAAMPGGGMRFASGLYRLPDGTIAGSALTLVKAVKNMVDAAGVSLSEAVEMASLNPARFLGMSRNKGSLQPGFDADLAVFDERFKVMLTIIGGRPVFSRKAV